LFPGTKRSFFFLAFIFFSWHPILLFFLGIFLLFPVGKNVEFSSTSGVGLDTLTLGDGTFVADSVMCGMPTVSHGTMRSREVHLKDQAFIGNGSFVREGSVIANDTLIALQTAAPRCVKRLTHAAHVGSRCPKHFFCC
jgi:carbonic anhydrase/acetyltransferase-like protein (isoleucine patch superfamily)